MPGEKVKGFIELEEGKKTDFSLFLYKDLFISTIGSREPFIRYNV